MSCPRGASSTSTPMRATVFRGENGSCLVSHLAVRNNLFVIILFSDCKTTFDGLDSKYMIGELKKLKKGLGETE